MLIFYFFWLPYGSGVFFDEEYVLSSRPFNISATIYYLYFLLLWR